MAEFHVHVGRLERRCTCRSYSEKLVGLSLRTRQRNREDGGLYIATDAVREKVLATDQGVSLVESPEEGACICGYR